MRHWFCAGETGPKGVTMPEFKETEEFGETVKLVRSVVNGKPGVWHRATVENVNKAVRRES